MNIFKGTVEINEGSQSSHQNGNHSTYGMLQFLPIILVLNLYCGRQLAAEEPVLAPEDEEEGEERVWRLLGPRQEEEESAEETTW